MKKYKVQYRENGSWVTFEYTFGLDKALDLLYRTSSTDPSCDHRILLVTEDVVCEYKGQEVNA